MALRYVILRHEGIDRPHFDLMFETSPTAKLSTWRSDIWPIVQPTKLLKLADHRREYLTYEGPVSRNRGRVRRIEGGECTALVREDAHWRVRFPSGVELRMVRCRDDMWNATTGQPP